MELSKKLNVMADFARAFNYSTYVSTDRVFQHDGRLYATDGRIMIVTETDSKPGLRYYERQTLKSPFKAFTKESSQKARETIKYLESNNFMEKLIDRWNYSDLTFTLDFSDFDLPASLMKRQNTTKTRYNNKNVCLHFAENEGVFQYGCPDDNDSVTATYSDILKNVEGKAQNIATRIWYIIAMLKLQKDKKLSFEVFTERGHCRVKTDEFTFYFTLNERTF